MIQKNIWGVMQGRLLLKYLDKYQAHPAGYWQEEFAVAKKLGIGSIEFILDKGSLNTNPLLHATGRRLIRLLSDKHGVLVRSVCADYFMEEPEDMEILNKLLLGCSEIGVKNIVLPCLEKSSIQKKDQKKKFEKMIREPLKIAEKKKINLALETDLPPETFARILARFDSEHLTVNYDIGNSASLGFNPQEEFNAYGKKITDVHIKDRKIGSGPVILGNGDADFNQVFFLLNKVNYKGVFIMQAYRDDEGIEIFKKQFNWVQNKAAKYGFI